MNLLTRTDNYERLHELMNSPEIFPWVCGDYDYPLDAWHMVEGTIVLENEHGAFWFIETEHGVWDAHTLFPPKAPYTYEAALEAIEYIRSLPGYEKITTQGPRNNPRAIRFLEKLGFVYTHTEGVYQGHPLDYYEKR